MRKLMLLAALFVAAGCDSSSSSSGSSIDDRQKQALADPMNYKPPTQAGVSDNKGLKDDLHHFFDP
jgi:hypothetical protein